MTEIKDLRDFISALDSAGQLIKISKPVSIEHELADVGASVAREGKGACLFENVIGSPWPVFCGGVASHSRAAIALSCELSEVADTMEKALDPSNGLRVWLLILPERAWLHWAMRLDILIVWEGLREVAVLLQIL